jgi:diaminopimelate epimerase|tara:strand:- start:4666 stop:5448 length:783 start_codon:yes stop_codon:yes gene_type:complete
MISFDKMHGNGNDFIVMNSIEQDFIPSMKFIKKNADRQTGIGFDQLILIGLPIKENSDFMIKFYNADGGEADMCLNGIRCAVAYIWKHSFAAKRSLVLETNKKIIICKPAGKSIQASFDMPLVNTDTKLYSSLQKSLKNEAFFIVDAGNKHLCLKKRSIKNEDLDALYSKLKKIIRPHNINLSIFKHTKELIEIRTYENGVGETLSCGSASASVASLYLNSKINKVTVSSSGGEIKFSKSKNGILMTGPSAHIFSGDIND